MQFGAMNSPIKPILDEIDDFAALGFDYLELTMDAPRAHYSNIQSQMDDIRKRLRRHGMGLVCHMPTFVYTADLTASIREASLAEVIHSLETAADLEAMKIVLHPSIISGLGGLVKEEAVAHALESLSTIYHSARQLGLTLCFENMFPRLAYMVEPREFAEIFNLFPDMRLTLDTGHAFIDARREKRIIDFIRHLPDRIAHLHISDNRGKRDDHLPLGKGGIRFEKITTALEGIGYNETCTLEIFTEDRGDLVKSRDTLEAMLGRGR
jgi:sugar phosphate isomerase/epimerase